MKAVILAGGLGTRLSEETNVKPKPMIEIGERPIIWHIMKTYSEYGINDFIICCGYKGYAIKEYFSNYFIHNSDVSFSMENNSMKILKPCVDPWNITLIDTGSSSMTGERLKRVGKYLQEEEDFCLTYGDGVANVNISKLINFHKSHGKEATVTAAHPPGRFGALKITNNQVMSFAEKPKGDGEVINAGYFVLSKKVLDRIPDNNCTWEQEPLESLAKDNNLMAFQHEGFWHPMDTLKDKEYLEELWGSGKAPWKVWK
ncbi:glucose-1-phosphate cytidylyltransferase [Candidatus Pseudothioglobus sp. Uisw_086]|uniref:glucose-1-phosphate cytidylyltransferase n=1 Tax=Candidatus Pseudothioglobus sp. Uisw_086 TaxID=3230998 RepID=UPI003A8642D7